MPDVRNIFIEYLKKKNMKLTRQREVILDSFLDSRQHVSVEDFYNVMKKKDATIGHATVFRTLKLLCEADIAKEVELGDKRVRYECNYGHEHHDHLVCVRCGTFIEAVDPAIEKLQDKLCREFSFTPHRHRMEIFGVCKKCR
jgi:Fur family ferric uptake transcriptional regulator